jgi:hypothetical protein
MALGFLSLDQLAFLWFAAKHQESRKIVYQGV